MGPWTRYAVRTAAIIACAAGATVVQAQALSVQPVTIQFAAGQRATALTVVNHGTAETSFQVRAFGWSQSPDGKDVLTDTNAIAVSPPLGTIPADGSQIVRLVLREAPSNHETSFRLWLDQIPPAAAAGTVRVALRLSLPIFALPSAKVLPVMHFHVEQAGGAAYLFAANNGSRHEKIDNVELRDGTGTILRLENGTSPYILPGTVKQWRIAAPAGLQPGGSLKLSAHAETIKVANQPVAVTSIP